MQYKKQNEEKLYKLYVTNCLQAISENTAKNIGGKYISKIYSDIIEPKKQIDEVKEDGNAIIARIRKQGKGVNNGN